MEKKIEAASAHGVNVFIYDWYWYYGRPFLEDGLHDGFLGAKNNGKMQFFLMWANHNWTEGCNNKVSRRNDRMRWNVAQSPEDFRAMTRRVIDMFFSRPNYYRIGGKPVFMIYEATHLVRDLGGREAAAKAMRLFQEDCRAAGFDGVHVMACSWRQCCPEDIETLGIESATMYTYAHHIRPRGEYGPWAKKGLEMLDAEKARLAGLNAYFGHATVGWDTNPRYPETMRDVVTSTPAEFEAALRDVKGWCDRNTPPGYPKMISINAWNEWIEGSYLEPDEKHGMGYLEAIRRVFAPEYFVSPRGDDAAAGTIDAPFATLERARNAVRATKTSGGATIWLRGGEYKMDKPLVLGREDSGEKGAPIAYRAWGDETPVLSGAWTVPASAWRRASDPRIPAVARDKVWEADVKSLGYDALEPDAPCGFHTVCPHFRIRSLYRNGRHLPLARYPDGGFIRTGSVRDAGRCVFTADVGEWTRWSPQNAPDLRALGYWKWLWADQTLPVTVDPAAKTLALDLRADGSRDVGRSFHLSDTTNVADSHLNVSVGKGRPFCLLNALAALDSPGEWHLDRKSGRLFVYPPDGMAPGIDVYELSRAAHSMLVAKDVDHLRFEGIVFRGGRHHGVEFRNVSDVSFEGCVVRDFGGNGLLLKGANGCTVRGNVFRTFGHCAMELEGGDRRTLSESGTTIEANDFSDTGLAMRTYTPGIVARGCGHRIVRNYMHNIPSSALRVAGNEHLVASNLVENVVLESDDQGGVDMWGDPTFRGNRFVHNIWRGIGRGGNFVHCGQAGIRFDDAISGNLVYGNRFDNCSRGKFGGVQIHGGRHNVVRNNVFTRCRHGVSFSPWGQGKWRGFLTDEKGVAKAKAANADGAAFRAKYPEYATEADAPMVNTVENNVFEGDKASFIRHPLKTAVLRGNVCVKKLPGDLSAIPGFDPLPPESAIGPGDDAMLKRARRRAAPAAGDGVERCAAATSPDGRNVIRLRLEPLAYEIERDGAAVVARSEIGMKVDGRSLERDGNGRSPVVCAVEKSARGGFADASVYKKSRVDLAANETFVDFGAWGVRLVARNDGVAYRFETSFPGRIRVDGERAELRPPAADVKCRGNQTSAFGCEETLPFSSRASEIDLSKKMIYMPFAYETGGRHVLATDVDVRNYPVWNFGAFTNGAFEAKFARAPRKAKKTARWIKVTEREDFLVETEGTRTFPWRAFILADEPVKFCVADIAWALAPAQDAGADFSWVKPGKVAWDWWNDYGHRGRGKTGGCCTKTYERYIDFAAANGLEYVIFDAGWSDGLNIWKFNPMVDVPHLIGYAEKKGVGVVLWMAWSEVCGAEGRVAEHFAKLGAKGFKIDFMDRGDAEVAEFLEKFAAECAKHRMLVDYHGVYRPTGLQRRYPNVLNYEGVHGLETMKWFNGDEKGMLYNDVAACYLRMSAGPLDYTPGAMLNFGVGSGRKGSYSRPGALGTRSRQMAMMALYEAPLQMFCDSTEHYAANSECVSFMAKIPTVWKSVTGLAGTPETMFVAARETRCGEWYAGGIAAMAACDCGIDTSFLGGGEWTAEIFRDVDDAKENAQRYVHETHSVKAGEKISLHMAPGGGFVVRFSR
jgi:alpha-glucosidase